ncbi:MAG: SPOR domain-containing protein [Desulfuromonadaceae bacterium]
MVQQVKSRSQRRMEKKQALLLVVLLLGISLVSFFLGILVGRNGSRPDSVPAQVVVTRPLPVSPPAAEPAPTAPAKIQPEVQPEAKEEPLTFYDDLTKGEQTSLGSGINLPPATEPAPVKKSPPVKIAATASVQEAPPAIEPPAVLAPLPKPVSQGGYVVQVAAFRQPADALSLRDKLTKNGYPVFTQGAALGDKGVWYRVMVGPYADNGAASTVAEHLKSQEKLVGIVKKN